MGEYEPDDSRDVTLVPSEAPGEPPRTGPREDEARRDGGDGSETEHPPGEPPRDEQLAAKDAQDAAREGGPARES